MPCLGRDADRCSDTNVNPIDGAINGEPYVVDLEMRVVKPEKIATEVKVRLGKNINSREIEGCLECSPAQVVESDTVHLLGRRRGRHHLVSAFQRRSDLKTACRAGSMLKSRLSFRLRPHLR